MNRHHHFLASPPPVHYFRVCHWRRVPQDFLSTTDACIGVTSSRTFLQLILMLMLLSSCSRMSIFWFPSACGRRHLEYSNELECWNSFLQRLMLRRQWCLQMYNTALKKILPTWLAHHKICPSPSCLISHHTTSFAAH